MLPPQGAQVQELRSHMLGSAAKKKRGGGLSRDGLLTWDRPGATTASQVHVAFSVGVTHPASSVHSHPDKSSN